MADPIHKAATFMTHQRWTQTDITALRARHGAAETVQAIAHALQRTPENVASMMARLRLRAAA
jgi:hypothetical protein